MDNLIIDRQKWGRGDRKGKLLSSITDKMCCLGFECRRLGFSKANILDVSLPSHLPHYIPTLRDLLPDWLVRSAGDVGFLATVNDACVSATATEDDFDYLSSVPNERFREEYIKTIFYMHDVNVEFIN